MISDIQPVTIRAVKAHVRHFAPWIIWIIIVMAKRAMKTELPGTVGRYSYTLALIGQASEPVRVQLASGP